MKTLEEVTQVAEMYSVPTHIHDDETSESIIPQLQAFYQRAYEDGRKYQRESDADLCVSTYKDYFGNELPCFDTTFEASLAIRNNTGE